MSSRLKGFPVAAVAVATLVLAAYANHFENGFHFDDTHAILDNAYIRDLRHIPRYFVDATTFSVLPSNRAYRPVLQTTLALDYFVAGGYRPWWFQADTFAWFLLLLAAMAALFWALTGSAWVALVGAGLFGLHPVAAETVNYIIQRGDLLSTFGVVGALAAFAWRPRCEGTPPFTRAAWTAACLGLFAFGVFAKPPALVFPVLLMVYLRLFEPREPLLRALAPSMAVAMTSAAWTLNRTPATLSTGSDNPAGYLLAQPYVALRYFTSFFAPTGLTADNDWPLATGIGDPMVTVGCVFLIAIAWAAGRLGRSPDGRPVAFGLIWFIVALLPTSLTPMAEVANDHRMFFAFVGLSLAAASAGVWLVARLPAPAGRPAVLAAMVSVVFMAEASGVRARNEVWRTDEGLWREVTEKSPQNGRGWMNYGVTLMDRGDNAGAIAAYERALPLAPSYSLLRVNMGIAYGRLGRHAEAEPHFLQGIRMAPLDWRSHARYAGWLAGRGRMAESLVHAEIAAELNPQDPEGAALAVRAAGAGGTPEYFVWRSLAESRMGRYRESLASAERAAALRPGYAEALNNVAAAHMALGEWEAAVGAAEAALRANPGHPLARENLARAERHLGRRP